MSRPLKALFLCNELAGYFASCIELLYRSHHSVIKVVCYPSSPVAPFNHGLDGIELILKTTIDKDDLQKMCLTFDPDITYVGGWVDREYKSIAKGLKEKGRIVVAGLDNAWKGTLRQKLASFLSGFIIRPYFTHFWVAGHRQYQFARRLGYSHDNIIFGLYAAEISSFKGVGLKETRKRLVYVGRFELIKGISLLYDVFNSLTSEERNGWSLEMIGNGSLKKDILPTSSIAVHDFMQPKDLIKFVSGAGGFILPSIDEPWGVVVHEFAAAGMPLLLSNSVNSGEAFLIHGYNGFKFQSQDFKSLKAILIRFFAMDDPTLRLMGERSMDLAFREDSKYWVASLLSLLDLRPSQKAR